MPRKKLILVALALMLIIVGCSAPEPTSADTPEPTPTETPEPTETNTPQPTNIPQPTGMLEPTNTPKKKVAYNKMDRGCLTGVKFY